jgi:hypothetical protein
MAELNMTVELAPILTGHLGLKWSQKIGQLAKVYPKPLRGYENGKTPEAYRPV